MVLKATRIMIAIIVSRHRTPGILIFLSWPDELVIAGINGMFASRSHSRPPNKKVQCIKLYSYSAWRLRWQCCAVIKWLSGNDLKCIIVACAFPMCLSSFDRTHGSYSLKKKKRPLTCFLKGVIMYYGYQHLYSLCISTLGLLRVIWSCSHHLSEVNRHPFFWRAS